MNTFIRTYIVPAAVFQSVIIGGGYGTGREVVEFITVHGPVGGLWACFATTLVFSDYGIPVIFYRDHHEMLRNESRFFARKIAETDPDFRATLLDHYVDGEDEAPGGDMIASYYTYMARRGRDGRRHAQRFWERSTTLDDSKEVLVIACKKWHIGQAFAKAVERVCGIASLGYVFDQDEPLDLPLGNLEVGKDKRGRHRRAFLTLLLDARKTDKLALCVDPSRDDVVRDFADTDCRIRILIIETDFAAGDYVDHARRVALPMIWAALVMYSISLLRETRTRP